MVSSSHGGSLLADAVASIVGCFTSQSVVLDTDLASTVSFGSPGLLQLEEEEDDAVELSDDVMLLTALSTSREVTLARTRLACDVFIGNSSVVGPGSTLLQGAFLGMLSYLPAGTTAEPGTRWIGNPATQLPASREADSDDAEDDEVPTPGLGLSALWIGPAGWLAEAWVIASHAGIILALWTLREIIKCVVDPPAAAGTSAVAALWGLLVGASSASPLPEDLWAWRAPESWRAPLGNWRLVLLLALAMLKPIKLAVAWFAKWMLVGTLEEGSYPRDGPLCRRKVVLDALMTDLQLTVLPDLLGTPLMPAWLRAVGAQIGPGCCIQTPFFSEPDLARVGAGVCLGEGSELQSHRVEGGSLRLGAVEVGEGATLHCEAIAVERSRVAPETELYPLSMPLPEELVRGPGSWAGNPLVAVERFAPPRNPRRTQARRTKA